MRTKEQANAQVRASLKKLRARRKQEGKCVECGRRAAEGHTLCAAHLSSRRKREANRRLGLPNTGKPGRPHIHPLPDPLEGAVMDAFALEALLPRPDFARRVEGIRLTHVQEPSRPTLFQKIANLFRRLVAEIQ